MSLRNTFQDRQYVIIGVFIATAVLLLGRAAQLQLIDTAYRNKAAAIAIDKSVVYPSRGLIYDRSGELLVYNNPLYDLMVTYRLMSPKMDTFKFCRQLGIDTATFSANLNKDFKMRYSQSIPFPFMTMISPQTFARFQESMSEFPGFFVQVRNVRGYPQHSAGHVLGYIDEVNDDYLRKHPAYEPGDYKGASGLEAKYEDFLRGKRGIQYTLKDNVGRLVGPYDNGALDSAAIAGRDMLTGLDLKLQALGEKLLQNKAGAVVAIEPSTGEILAMVSSPNFDPEKLTINKERSATMQALLTDSLKPLFDRTISAQYTPGSVFKPMLALIALQMNVWDKDRGMGCNGGYFYKNLRVKCHHHPPSANLEEGIENSCNNYFCTLYRAMVDKYGFYNPHEGLDSLSAYAAKFGLGAQLGIDLFGEKKGFIPSSKFYDKSITAKGLGKWYSTALVSNGIGQGENQLTLLQIANMCTVIANRGFYYQPHVVKGFKDGSGIDPKYTFKHYAGIDPAHFAPVVAGMRKVIDYGTGSNARIPGVVVCGKTGTTQTTNGNDNSVFMGFAPMENPKIAIAVYVENGGWGNDFAAPITGLMIEQFLKGSIAPDRQALVEKVRRARLAHGEKGYYVVRSDGSAPAAARAVEEAPPPIEDPAQQ